MALQTRTLTEALNLTLLWTLPLVTDQTLTAAERAQIVEARQRVDAILADVNPNTNLVPQNRRQAHASTLRDRVHAIMIISDKYWANSPEILYDACDLWFDAASIIEAGLPTITSDLSPAHP